MHIQASQRLASVVLYGLPILVVHVFAMSCGYQHACRACVVMFGVSRVLFGSYGGIEARCRVDSVVSRDFSATFVILYPR